MALSHRQQQCATLATAIDAVGPTRGDISNPGANVVNYDSEADWNSLDGNVTTVGSAGSLSDSFYGTADQGGNVFEWNDVLIISPFRGLRAGAWGGNGNFLQSSLRTGSDPTAESLFSVSVWRPSLSQVQQRSACWVSWDCSHSASGS